MAIKMNNYVALDKQVYSKGEFKIVPIRHEDRYSIMKWRNEQIYHLRQTVPLDQETQDKYFDEVVSKLYEVETPNQLLFSFLKGETCIGYGGLVHINWVDQNAEISFIMDTALESESFLPLWHIYLDLIEQVGFVQLKLHKLYVYAFDLRPHLYSMLEKANYVLDARLKEHARFRGKYVDVVIYYKLG